MKTGILYGVGIGPGDPRYLTLRAAEVLRSADVIFTVISRNAEDSVSKSVVEWLQPQGRIELLTFSMSRNNDERFAKVRANAELIITELAAGKNCAFATLGDAMTYSTFGYIMCLVKEALPHVEIETVPGINSFTTLASLAGEVLVENRAQLRVIPSFKAENAEALEFPPNSTTILLKSYHSREALIKRLEREENIEIIYGEELTMEGQCILRSLDEIKARPDTYLSLIMVKKK